MLPYASELGEYIQNSDIVILQINMTDKFGQNYATLRSFFELLFIYITKLFYELYEKNIRHSYNVIIRSNFDGKRHIGIQLDKYFNQLLSVPNIQSVLLTRCYVQDTREASKTMYLGSPTLFTAMYKGPDESEKIRDYAYSYMDVLDTSDNSTMMRFTQSNTNILYSYLLEYFYTKRPVQPRSIRPTQQPEQPLFISPKPPPQQRLFGPPSQPQQPQPRPLQPQPPESQFFIAPLPPSRRPQPQSQEITRVYSMVSYQIYLTQNMEKNNMDILKNQKRLTLDERYIQDQSNYPIQLIRENSDITEFTYKFDKKSLKDFFIGCGTKETMLWFPPTIPL